MKMTSMLRTKRMMMRRRTRMMMMKRRTRGKNARIKMEIHLWAGQKKEKTVQKPGCHFLTLVSYVTFPGVPDVTDYYVNISVLSSPLPFTCQFGKDCCSLAVVSCRVNVSSKTHRSRKCSRNATGDRFVLILILSCTCWWPVLFRCSHQITVPPHRVCCIYTRSISPLKQPNSSTICCKSLTKNGEKKLFLQLFCPVLASSLCMILCNLSIYEPPWGE